MTLRAGAVAYVNADTYPPIVNSARTLSDSGWLVDILCRSDGKEWGVRYGSGVTIARVGRKQVSSVREYSQFLLAAARHFQRRVPDIFVGHDMHGFLIASLLGAAVRRPVVYYCHDLSDRTMPLGAGGRAVRAWEGRFARTADLVIVADEERAREVRQQLHLPSLPLVVANSPLVRPAYSGAALSKALAAQGRTYSRVVLRQGKIGHGHGIESTIRSIPRWADPTWGFVVLGPADETYRAGLEALACQVGVGGRFTALAPVSYDRVLELTAGADLGHALYEPIHLNNRLISTASNKAMEYLASGLPLLVSSRTNLGDFIARTHTGVAVDDRDPTQIARAVNSLLLDDAALARFRDAARATFEARYRFERQFAPALDRMHALAVRQQVHPA